MRVLGFLTLTFTLTLSAAPPSPRLWYAQPATKWEEALPIGSGRLGAMVFGGTAEERIQFNEDTLWLGKPHNYVRAGSADIVPQVRQLLAAGQVKEAQDLARAKMLSDPVRQKAYQPFGDLRLTFPAHGAASNYSRELNLDEAIARTRYEVDGVTYIREVIASYPDQVIAVRLTSSHPGALTFTVRMDSPHKDSVTSLGRVGRPGLQSSAPPPTAPDTLTLTGRVQPDGLRFESRVRVLTDGGTVRADGSTLVISGADSATLLLVAATSFRTFEDISADPALRCAAYLTHWKSDAPATGAYSSLLARHTADHQRLFRRVSLNLVGPALLSGRSVAKADVAGPSVNPGLPASGSPTPDPATLPTAERLKRVRRAGSIDADPGLAALEFAFGRYLLIASSRPGTQPANLQGVWNELLDPPWESKYTTNINFEMNYWLAELTGLGECHEPFFAAIEDLRASGARTARELYRSRGWVLHHNFDLWRGTAPINNIDGLWPTGGAWLCHHLWERWLFTRDRDFLAHRAYPAMREASLFFVDYLVRDPKTGWLLSSPSHSPEQGPTTTGPTIDNQLVRFLWTATISAARELDTDAAFANELEGLLPQLPPNQIGRHGQLQEWLDDVDVPNNAHRHMSPLWALYPGADITPADAKLYDATKLLLKWRGDGSTGWSYAWRAPLWARVGDGEMAYRQLSQLLTKRTLPNLFDLCGPFQIDGNFGFTAGVVEMLLQSHCRAGSPNPATVGAVLGSIGPATEAAPNGPASAKAVEGNRPYPIAEPVLIDLLPSLPKAWPTGSVTGLRARDGFEVDLTWSDGALARVTIRSTLGRPAQIRYAGQTLNVHLPAGQSTVLDAHLRPIN
jgi:alpha-L-fucosidase 2